MRGLKLINLRWSITLLTLIIFSLSVVAISEIGYQRRNQAYDDLIKANEATTQLDDLMRQMVDVEAAQRGYLLTHRNTYLEPYEKAKPVITTLVQQLKSYFVGLGDRYSVELMDQIVSHIGDKLTEVEMTIDFTKTGKSEVAGDLVQTDLGKQQMDALRSHIEELQHRQRLRIKLASDTAQSVQNLGRLATALISAVNIVLLILMVRLVWRERENDRHKQQELEQQQVVLDELVKERTTQLEMLATHLQNVSEAEKSRLARELHDELGSILTASKMDVMWVKKRLQAQPELVEKLDRAMKNLDVGIQSKRRIIEDLRPSTLITFGLTTAAQELVEQVSERAGWALESDMPEGDPDLPENISIALFRILQEALNNAEKYAHARMVKVQLQTTMTTALLDIKDDGVGFYRETMRPKSHGLSGMRQRVHALGGSIEIYANPGAGTRIRVELPIPPKPKSQQE